MWELLINLLASAIVGVAVWVTQRLLQLRKLARKQAFFGARPGEEVLHFVAKHHSSPRENSVNRTDVACLIEVASAIRDCGGIPTLLTSEENRPQAGRVTEYSIGGPLGNPRTEAYLRTDFPGVRFVGDSEQLPLLVGTREFRLSPGREEFVLLARTQRSASSRPAFLLAGQTARANLAAARLLSERYTQLNRDYPPGRDFCLVLRVSEPAAFGPDRVEIVEDVTLTAKTPLPPEEKMQAA